MVHNGIEYGDMQLIAEAYDIMRTSSGFPPGRWPTSSTNGTAARWNRS